MGAVSFAVRLIWLLSFAALAFVTYQMYNLVRDAMLAEIKAVPGIWDDCSEIAVLGVRAVSGSSAAPVPI